MKEYDVIHIPFLSARDRGKTYKVAVEMYPLAKSYEYVPPYEYELDGETYTSLPEILVHLR